MDPRADIGDRLVFRRGDVDRDDGYAVFGQTDLGGVDDLEGILLLRKACPSTPNAIVRDLQFRDMLASGEIPTCWSYEKDKETGEIV